MQHCIFLFIFYKRAWMNVYLRGGKKDLPKRSTHTKEAIQCDSHQTQNWDEGQRDDHAAEKQTAVDRSLGSTVHCHGRRDGHAANQKVGHSQGDNQAQGGLLEGLRGPKRQNDKHVAEAAEDSSEHLQGRVDHFADFHSFTSTFSPDREQEPVRTGLFYLLLMSVLWNAEEVSGSETGCFFFFFMHVVSLLEWFPFGCAGHAVGLVNETINNCQWSFVALHSLD